MLYVFNTTEIGGREYTSKDLKRIYPVNHQKFGLRDDFYGGRISCIGETNTDVVLLMYNNNGLQVIDTGAMSLNNIPIENIKEIAIRRKIIDKKNRLSKEELIDLIEGRPVVEKKDTSINNLVDRLKTKRKYNKKPKKDRNICKVNAGVEQYSRNAGDNPIIKSD